MLCKSTTGLPPNPYEIDHKNCSLVCMHLRLCPWAPLCAQRIILQSWFVFFFFSLHICWSFSLTPLYPDRAWVFFLAVFFKDSICVLSLKKKIPILHCRTKKMSPTIFFNIIHRKKKGLWGHRNVHFLQDTWNFKEILCLIPWTKLTEDRTFRLRKAQQLW